MHRTHVIVPVKCLNPRCGTEFAEDANGRSSVELIHTGVDRAFVCPVCQHWNRLGDLAGNIDRTGLRTSNASFSAQLARQTDA